MRILVTSDLHHMVGPLERACEAQPEAKQVIFLGDGASNAQTVSGFFPEKEFVILSGNCDIFSQYPSQALINIGEIKILAAHGHTFSVKNGTQRLLQAAKNAGALIALYGHTHVAKIEYCDGVYLVNPGSLSEPRQGRPSYGVIDITPAGIVPNIILL